MKTCTKCGEDKELDQFHPNFMSPSGIRNYCVDCHKIQMKEWYSKNKQRNRESHLKRKYGLNIEQYEQILQQQNGCCAICNREASQFRRAMAVDHIHKGPRAGFIRGILCDNCNRRLIGQHVDGNLLRKMADYVDQDLGICVPEAMINTKKKRKKKVVKQNSIPRL